MMHPFSSRPSFVGVTDEMFGFGVGVPLEPAVSSLLTQRARSLIDPDGGDGSVWGNYQGLYQEAMSTLRNGQPAEIDQFVDNLFGSALTHGFAQGHIATPALRTRQDSRMHVGALILDRFYRLAEAVGASRVQSLEHGQVTIDVGDIDAVMDRIEERVGASLSAPRQIGGMFGLRIRGAIFTERHFDGLYAAWRARQLADGAGLSNPAILEIGGGSGFLAFYARKLGFTRVAIVDLPHPGLVQYIGLASEFGAQHVTFDSVPHDGIGLVPADSAAATQFSGWDLVVNVDSLPEMSPEHARGYLGALRRGQLLLSINQESAIENGPSRQNVVSELAASMGLLCCQRTPSWLRSGYVEEIYTCQPDGEIVGFVDFVRDGAVHGWIANKSHPHRGARIVCRGPDGSEMVFQPTVLRADVCGALSTDGVFGFEVPIEVLRKLGPVISICNERGEHLHGGETVILEPPHASDHPNT